MKHVLIVDDAVSIRRYHRRLMEDLGLAVEEAANGLEALEKSLSLHFDLVLVDINMPKMDGYRLLEELRRQATNADIPAIMISTEGEQDDRERAYAAGANFYLPKPTLADDLQTYVKLLTEID